MPSNWWHRFEDDIKDVSSYIRLVPMIQPFVQVYYKDIFLDVLSPNLMEEYSYEYDDDGNNLHIQGYKPALSSLRKKLFVLQLEASRKEIKQTE